MNTCIHFFPKIIEHMGFICFICVLTLKDIFLEATEANLMIS